MTTMENIDYALVVCFVFCCLLLFFTEKTNFSSKTPDSLATSSRRGKCSQTKYTRDDQLITNHILNIAKSIYVRILTAINLS